MANTAEIGRDTMMKENNLPFVSVIVPVYNGEKTIGQCIESLLAQNYPLDKYEIIVVDNNSKDKTAEIVKKYPVKYVMENKIQSSYAARNTGAKVAKGEALAFFDDDQFADRNWLRNLLKEWGNKKIGAFCGKIVALNSMGSLLEKFWGQDETTKIEKVKFNKENKHFLKFGAGNGAFPKEIFDLLGGFNDTLFSMGDFDIALRLQKGLGLLIKYNPEAIVYHKSPDSWEVLLKREYRMGFG